MIIASIMFGGGILSIIDRFLAFSPYLLQYPDINFTILFVLGNLLYLLGFWYWYCIYGIKASIHISLVDWFLELFFIISVIIMCRSCVPYLPYNEMIAEYLYTLVWSYSAGISMIIGMIRIFNIMRYRLKESGGNIKITKIDIVGIGKTIFSLGIVLFYILSWHLYNIEYVIKVRWALLILPLLSVITAIYAYSKMPKGDKEEFVDFLTYRQKKKGRPKR
jgi:hypothetical protein